jgi:prepilin-type N-terminal cleavage/methylation domain-containing protein
MKKTSGFTLIELMIVVAIIAIIAAIAIPNLLRSRLQSNESAAIGNMRTVNTAETSYHAAKGKYATAWADLTGGTPKFLDGTWTDATVKSGYTFALAGTDTCYTVNGEAVTYQQTGERSFFTDCSGTLRHKTGTGAAATDKSIDEAL